MYNSVCVDIEGHLDLWHAARRWRNSNKVKSPERAVLRCHLALSLQYMNGYGCLPIRCCREYLALAAWDRRISRNETRKHSAQCLDTKRKRRNVEEEYILDVSTQDASLDRRADGNCFVGIDPLGRLLTEYLANHLLHARHTGHTTYENYLVYL